MQLPALPDQKPAACSISSITGDRPVLREGEDHHQREEGKAAGRINPL